MFIFIFLLFVVFLNHGMNAPLSLGKRKGAQLEHSPKVARNIYGQPSLEEIPDDITKIILMYVLSPNSNEPGQKINFTVKGSHACARVNKKLYRLTSQALKDLYGVLSTQHPGHVLQAVNDACITPKRIPCLKRLIESVPGKVFNLTPRITPLMVAVGYNNEYAVDLLLEGAKKRGILKRFVDLNCGNQENDILNDENPKYIFDCRKHFTAVHIAASAENNRVAPEILKKLLEAGASVNLLDEKGDTALVWALAHTSAAEAKVTLLMEYKADAHLGSEVMIPYERVEEELEADDPLPSYVLFGQLFTARLNKLL